MTLDRRPVAFTLAAFAMCAAPRPVAADPLVFVTAFAPGERGGSDLLAPITALALRPAAEEPAVARPPAPVAVQPDPAPITEPLPRGSTLRFGTALFRQGTAIERMAVSPDGKLAVAAGGLRWVSRGHARAFDLTTGRVRYTLGLGLVEAVAFSPDGTLLAALDGGNLHLFDATTGKALRKIALPQAGGSRSLFGILVFAPDSKTVATSNGGVVQLVDLDKGEVAKSLTHQSIVFAGAFSPDGKLLAADGYESDGPVYFTRLWDVTSGKEVRRFKGGRSGLRALAFSPDGKTLAAGGDSDGVFRLWDVATGKERYAQPADGTRIRSIAFAPDGQTVAAAGRSIRLYDPATGRERLRIDHGAVGLHFTADGKTLTAAVGGSIRRWNAATGKLLTPEAYSDGPVDQLLTTPDARRLIAHDETGAAQIWDAVTGKHLRSLAMSWQRMALSPDGRLLAWLVADTRPYERSRIRLYDLNAEKQLDDFPAADGDAHDLHFGPDGKTLLTVDRGSGPVNRTGGTVRLWDVAARKELRNFRATPAEGGKLWQTAPWTSALSSDGKVLAVGYRRADHTTALSVPISVRLWDVATGKELHELKGHRDQVDDLAFSPNGRLVVSCGRGGVFVWDVATGQRIPQLPQGLPGGAGRVAFARDGRMLAAASSDGIRLWEVATWKQRTTLQGGHRDGVLSLHFGAAGRLFSGSADTTVLAWDVYALPATDAAPK